MKAILQNGFFALAIVLAQAIPASAQSLYNKRECIAGLKKAKRDIDAKNKGQYVFSKSDRNKAMSYYNDALKAYNKKNGMIAVKLHL